MPSNLRTFIAVSVNPADELRRVLDTLGEMGSAVKPAKAEGMHITLKFLGGTDSDLVPLILDAMREAVACASPFTMKLRGLDAFPKKERPSIVWAAIEGGEPLKEFASRLEEKTAALGFETEAREYTPHLTLARIRRKPPPELFELFAEHETTAFGEVAVDAVNLYQSELSPEGARYSVLGEVGLGEW